MLATTPIFSPCGGSDHDLIMIEARTLGLREIVHWTAALWKRRDLNLFLPIPTISPSHPDCSMLATTLIFSPSGGSDLILIEARTS